jgi:DnaJ-class molecular chaperone
MRTYYDILGIKHDVPQEIIAAVYRTWMHALRIHPDLGGDEALAIEINEAYQTLKDPRSREIYDKEVVCYATSSCDKGESRKAPRFSVDVEIAFSVAPFENWERARVLDASALGLKIRVSKKLEVGDNIAIAFQLSVNSAAEGSIKWKRCFGKNEYECGVEFFRAIPDVLKKLGM